MRPSKSSTPSHLVSVVGSLLLASSFLTACTSKTNGDGGKQPTTQGSAPETTYNFQQPTVTAVTGSSPVPAIGDTMHVFGSNFIDPQHGTLLLSFTGTFTDQAGNRTGTPSGGTQIPLTFVGAGEATFILGPDNVFGPSGTVGQFSGAFQVASQLQVPAVNGQIGDMSVSNPENLNVTIGPSIFLDELRSVDAASSGSPCSGVTPGTTGSQNIRLGFHYVGMDDASDDDPVFYTVTYDSSQLTAAYLANQTYSTWPDWGPSTPNAQAQVATGTGSFSVQTTTGNGTTFDPQSMQTVVTVSPAVTFNESQQTNVKLAGLATPAVAAGSTQPILLTIRAQHQSGTTINRVVSWNALGQVSFTQPTPQVLSAWEAATIDDHIGIVKGSIPNGTNMSYNESSSDTKQKTISMSWNINNSLQLSASANLGIGGGGSGASSCNTGAPVTTGTGDGTGTGSTTGTPPGGTGTGTGTGTCAPGAGGGSPVNFGISASASQTWSQTFGTDVSTSDSITTGEGSNTSVQVNPGMFGAFYIQWGDLTSSVHVLYNDACGNSTDVGIATLYSHVGYLAAETSTENPPPCPIDASDCHAAGPIAN